MEKKPETGTILFEVFLLTVVVLMVDEWMIRGALAFIPAMLLAQRALDAGSTKASENLTAMFDRRSDEPVREHVAKLLEHFRQFYATCHLMGSGGITPEEALHRTHDLEKDLSRLLNEVTKEPQAIEALEPLPTL
jgi:hypothetical protein